MQKQDKVKATLYINKDKNSGLVFVTTSSMEGLGYLTIGTKEIEVDIPSNCDILAATERMRKAQREKVEQDYKEALSKLDN